MIRRNAEATLAIRGLLWVGDLKRHHSDKMLHFAATVVIAATARNYGWGYWATR